MSILARIIRHCPRGKLVESLWLQGLAEKFLHDFAPLAFLGTCRNIRQPVFKVRTYEVWRWERMVRDAGICGIVTEDEELADSLQ